MDFFGQARNAHAHADPRERREKVGEGVTKLVRTHDLVRKLGRGGEGQTSLWKDRRSGALRVLKSYLDPYRDNTHEGKVLAELWKRGGHNNLIELLDFEHEPRTNVTFLHMPYCDGGDLDSLDRRFVQRRQQFPEIVIWGIMEQLMSALVFLHWKKGQIPLVHGDIKPPNILLQAPQSGGIPVVKLADFGLSKFVPNGADRTHGGTKGFEAPEFPLFTPAADVWAVGATVHCLCLGTPPVDRQWNPKPERVDRKTAHYHGKHTVKYSEELQKCVGAMLTFEVRNRAASKDLWPSIQVSLDARLKQFKHLANSPLPAWMFPDAPHQEFKDYPGERREERREHQSRHRTKEHRHAKSRHHRRDRDGERSRHRDRDHDKYADLFGRNARRDTCRETRREPRHKTRRDAPKQAKPRSPDPEGEFGGKRMGGCGSRERSRARPKDSRRRRDEYGARVVDGENLKRVADDCGIGMEQLMDPFGRRGDRR